jgi:Fur family transcriptional regulator, ferric uptake regulator
MNPMSATASDATGHQHARELHASAALRLRDDDQRYTSGRRALVELLADADRPLTVAEVLDRSDGLAQSSAYRNLALLERAGVVHRIVTDDEFGRFELAEDLTGHHHHHLICTHCGQVEDFTLPADLEDRLDDALHRVALTTAFTTDHHRLDLVGTCAQCRG